MTTTRLSTELGRLRTRFYSDELGELVGLCERLALRVEALETALERAGRYGDPWGTHLLPKPPAPKGGP